MKFAAVALLLLFCFFAVVPADAQAQSPLTIPITGTGPAGAVLNGTFTLTNFALNSANQLVANGVVSGTITRGGTTLATVLRNVSFVVDAAQSNATCDILHLELGPLDLTLLGLRVQLNRVVLDITAIPGGGLLGDLLCAVNNLLNPTGGLVTLLNQILGVLRGGVL